MSHFSRSFEVIRLTWIDRLPLDFLLVIHSNHGPNSYYITAVTKSKVMPGRDGP